MYNRISRYSAAAALVSLLFIGKATALTGGVAPRSRFQHPLELSPNPFITTHCRTVRRRNREMIRYHA